MSSLGPLLGVALSQYGFTDPYIGAIIGSQCDGLLQQGIDWTKKSIGNFWYGGTQNRLEIHPQNEPVLYKIVERYIIEKYGDRLHDCSLKSNPSGTLLTLTVRSLLGVQLTEMYRGHVINIKLKEMVPTLESTMTSPTNNSVYGIELSSVSGTIHILRSFIIDQCFKKHNERKTISIHHGYIEVSKKTEKQPSHVNVFWKTRETIITKTMKNTVVSTKVEQEVFKDLAYFMTAEHIYAEQGIPWTRGYLLYGPPGTGKTSIIKTCANEYHIPILVVSFDSSSTIEFFGRLMSETSVYTGNSPYILAIEDIDRAEGLFNRYEDNQKISGLLNELDGVTEAHGRILFITANNPEKLQSNKALMRPGRIDRSVEVSYCDRDQFRRLICAMMMMEELPDSFIPSESILKEKNFTPAAVIQVVLSRLALANLFSIDKQPEFEEKLNFLQTLDLNYDSSLLKEISDVSRKQEEDKKLRKSARITPQMKLRRIQLKHRCMQNRLKHLESEKYQQNIEKLKLDIEKVSQTIEKQKTIIANRKKREQAKAKKEKLAEKKRKAKELSKTRAKRVKRR